MSSKSYQKKYNYQQVSQYKKRPRARYNKTKQLVTGQGPTMLEQIASGVGSVAKLATAVAPIVSAINTELKYTDKTAAVNSYSPGTNDQIIALTSDIAQGTDDQNRVGNSILAKDISVRLAHSFQNTVGAPNVMGIHCRMMIICWKENAQINGPSAAKLFEAPNNLYSPVNKDYSDQFVVLKDKFFTLNSTVSISAPTGFVTMKWYKKLDWHMRFAGSAVATGTQNHIFLVLRSSATGVTNSLSTTYYSRMNFTDN